jgi:hypothetical protein
LALFIPDYVIAFIPPVPEIGGMGNLSEASIGFPGAPIFRKEYTSITKDLGIPEKNFPRL